MQLDKVGGIIVAAGRGNRMGSPLNKVYLPLGDDPVILHCLRVFERSSLINAYVVVANYDDLSLCRTLLNSFSLSKLAGIVTGGETRQQSVAAGLKALPQDCGLVAVHDAARPLLLQNVLEGAVQQAADAGAVVVAVPVKDTVKIAEKGNIKGTPERSSLWIAQTPQVFRRTLLKSALEEARATGFEGTDDASLVERLGHEVTIYQGSYENIKITTPGDLVIAQALLGIDTNGVTKGHLGRRTGLGYDVHPFCQGRPLYLGGLEIPEGSGLAGHSDGDVLLHALADACLGAAGLHDIGHHFPPSDPRWEGASSLALLGIVRGILAKEGYYVVQVDITVAAEKPRLSPYLEEMSGQIAAVLGIAPAAIGLKATTTEGLGFVGRGEGIACWAIATVEHKDTPSPV
jgi:2-C-methyl-D-erythritol 4-phosphate cytidylyltransferase/2-C-methyl-D-erythritol 2,4-cyclodiphosphate synthase